MSDGFQMYRLLKYGKMGQISEYNFTRVKVGHCGPGHLDVVAAEKEEEGVAGEAEDVEE